MTKEDGRNATRILIDFLYSHSTTWKDNPTLSQVSQDTIRSKNPIGFLALVDEEKRKEYKDRDEQKAA
jgi:hypothetical protein